MPAPSALPQIANNVVQGQGNATTLLGQVFLTAASGALAVERLLDVTAYVTSQCRSAAASSGDAGSSGVSVRGGAFVYGGGGADGADASTTGCSLAFLVAQEARWDASLPVAAGDAQPEGLLLVATAGGAGVAATGTACAVLTHQSC